VEGFAKTMRVIYTEMVLKKPAICDTVPNTIFRRDVFAVYYSWALGIKIFVITRILSEPPRSLRVDYGTGRHRVSVVPEMSKIIL
jgi:hypothetical protein